MGSEGEGTGGVQEPWAPGPAWKGHSPPSGQEKTLWPPPRTQVCFSRAAWCRQAGTDSPHDPPTVPGRPGGLSLLQVPHADQLTPGPRTHGAVRKSGRACGEGPSEWTELAAALPSETRPAAGVFDSQVAIS